MAHELLIEGGKASMMYVGKVPWHGLGTKLDEPATSAKAMEAASLAWRVKKVPLYAIEGGGAAAVPNRFAVVPEHQWGKSGCPIFGLVGKEYTPLQNEDAFAFFDSIVGMNAAMYHTAGALGHGKRVWILAKLPGQIRVVGDDVADKYLLLANGHDGNTAVQMKFTPVRVVCQNTLSVALSAGPAVSVHHGWHFEERMEDAKTTLGIITDRFARLEREFKGMAGFGVGQQQLNAYLKDVFPDPKQSRNKPLMQAAIHDRDQCVRLFECGLGNDLPGVKGTLWAAFNAVTDYVDHARGNHTGRQRLESVWFGKGYQIKVRAYRTACDLLKPEPSI